MWAHQQFQESNSYTYMMWPEYQQRYCLNYDEDSRKSISKYNNYVYGSMGYVAKWMYIFIGKIRSYTWLAKT